MKELIVGKTVAYAAKVGGGAIADINELALLQPGAVAVFLEDGTLIASNVSAATYPAGTPFFVAVGVSTNNPAGGVMIRRSRLVENIVMAVKKSYNAPAYKKVEIGYNGATGSLNLPATLITNSVSTVKVFVKEEVDPSSPLGNRMTVRGAASRAVTSSIRVTADDDQDSLVAKHVAELNASTSNNFFTAAVTGTYAGANLNIEITGTKYGQNFYIAVDDIMANATITTTTELDNGHGTSSQIAEVEAYANVENGNDFPIKYSNFAWQVPSQVTAGETYATWEFTFEKFTEKRHGTNSHDTNELTIAVGDGDTIETNLTTIFAGLTITVVDGDAW